MSEDLESLKLEELVRILSEFNSRPSDPLNGAEVLTMNVKTFDYYNETYPELFKFISVRCDDIMPDDIIIGWKRDHLRLPIMCLWIGPEKESSDESV